MNSSNDTSESVVYDDCTAIWRFRVPVAATTNRKRFEGMLSVVETLFEAFRPLLKPTLVEYRLSPYDEDDTDDIEESLVDPDGISFDQLWEPICSHKDGSDVSLGPLGFQGPITVRLSDGDYEIGSESDRYLRSDDERAPSEPPIRVSISQVGFMVPEGEYEYVIEITTHTSVWFEETKYGAVTRERLADVLATIEESLDPYAAEVTTTERYYGLEHEYPDLFFSYRSEFPDTSGDETEL